MAEKFKLEPLDPDAAAALMLELAKNTQAGAVLVTVAAIDSWLQKLLLTAMRPLTKKEAERIFYNFGPLYELAPKADMAYAFELVDPETLSRLRTLVKIRNIFAHTREPLNFESREIIDACHAFPGWKSGADPNMTFHRAAASCVQAIDAKTQELVYKKAVRDDALPDK